MTISTMNPGFCAVALGQGLLMGPAAQDDRWHDDGAGWALEEEEAEEVSEFEVSGFGHVLKAA